MKIQARANFRIAAASAALIYCLAAHASDGVVGPGNCDETGFVSVLDAVQSSFGGTITFDCGSTPTKIVVTASRDITSHVVIDGGDLITFDGDNAAGFFAVTLDSLTLKNLTLTHGASATGSVLTNSADLTVDHCTISQNANALAAINNSGTLNILSSTLSGNTVYVTEGPSFGSALRQLGGSTNIGGSLFSNNIGGGAGQSSS